MVSFVEALSRDQAWWGFDPGLGCSDKNQARTLIVQRPGAGLLALRAPPWRYSILCCVSKASSASETLARNCVVCWHVHLHNLLS